MSAEKPKRPESVGPVWVWFHEGEIGLDSDGHAIVAVDEYRDEHGIDVCVIVPVGADRAVSLRLTTKQAYSLAMALLRTRASVTRALKRAAN